jgi:hypothetical protein
VCLVLPISLDCPFLFAPSVFSDLYSSLSYDAQRETQNVKIHNRPTQEFKKKSNADSTKIKTGDELRCSRRVSSSVAFDPEKLESQISVPNM